MMKFSKVAAPALAAVAMAVAGIGQASATTSTQNLSFSSIALNWNQLVNVAKFDSSLGTLNSITFNYSAVFPSSSITVKNTGSATASWKGNAKNAFALYAGDLTTGSTAVTDMLSNDGVGALTDVDGNTASGNLTGVEKNLGSFNAGQSKTNTLGGVASLTSVFSFDLLSTAGDDLSLFIGSGTTALTMGGVAQTSATSSGSFEVTYTPLASGSLTVTYDYTPVSTVPEPESYAMLLAGLAAIGVVARRRRLS
jgi:hypothetical protein